MRKVLFAALAVLSVGFASSANAQMGSMGQMGGSLSETGYREICEPSGREGCAIRIDKLELENPPNDGNGQSLQRKASTAKTDSGWKSSRPAKRARSRCERPGNEG